MQTAIPGFHDAELCLLRHDRQGQTLETEFALTAGGRRKLLFSGVEEFRAVDVRSQNVVSRILVSQAPLAEDEIEPLLVWLQNDADGGVWRPKLSEQADKVRCGELSLLYLEPSAGAEVCVLAKAYEIG